MKRLFGLLLLIVAFNVSAIEVNSKLSGIWYNANQTGHGLNVVVLDENTTIIYWYVYHTDGTPMFLITVGQNQGNRVTGNTFYNTGMKFGEFDPNDVQETLVGTSTVTFNDCNTASLQYSISDPAYGSGTIPMERLASVSGLKCSDSPLHGTYHGNWVEPDEVGYGFTAFFENGDIVFFAEDNESAGAGWGQWSLTGSNSFSFYAYRYSITGGSRYVTGNGTFSEDEMTATFTGGGELFATPMPSFQHGLTTVKMAGNYNIHDWNDMVIGSVTVQDNGRITGATSDGCGIDGAFNVPNTNFNQAILDANIMDCGDTLRVLGAAVYRNATNEIVIAADDGWYGYVWTLKRK